VYKRQLASRSEGDHDGAVNILKNKGVEMGATYIMIKKEYSNHPGPYYIIEGEAYKPIAY